MNDKPMFCCQLYGPGQYSDFVYVPARVDGKDVFIEMSRKRYELILDSIKDVGGAQ